MKKANLKKLFVIKLAALLFFAAGLGASFAGCHSGTMRGVGSDVEKLGQRMER